jgi:hypothetical protein
MKLLLESGSSALLESSSFVSLESPAAADSGVGADVASVTRIKISVADSSAGTETQAIGSKTLATDGGTSTETQAAGVKMSSADSGIGGETQTIPTTVFAELTATYFVGGMAEEIWGIIHMASPTRILVTR